MSIFKHANQSVREGNYAASIPYYIQAIQTTPELARLAAPNLRLARTRYCAVRRQAERPRVAVCGWELSHNSAGRVMMLADLYASFSHIEIIGSIFPKYGKELWEPIRNTTIPCHSFLATDERRFVDQALQLVLAHPYDVVHLSKPRLPNVLFGLLYKTLWGARVIMDIDDEELSFVNADSPLDLDEYIQEKGRLHELSNLAGTEWTRIAVGLARQFDAVTVSNPALQKRYGGEIIPHARDEKLFQPSEELKRQSRARFGIPQDKKVILFFGTPRKHKGLLETARAIAGLDRADLMFLIAGDFPDPILKAELQEIKGLDLRFLDNQPFAEIPEVVAIGDICILLQDMKAAVSLFQVPAKLTDALAMGLKVLAEPTPALADLAARGAFTPVTRKNLPAVLRRCLSAEPADTDGRKVFQETLSFTANRPILESVLMKTATIKTIIPSFFPRMAPLSGFGSALQTALSYDSACLEQGVSVIILTLNAAHHLNKLLSSFLKVNTHQPIEIILIDHGSTDKTAEVIAKYATKTCIRHINRGRNYSFADSCNYGAAKAEHPYLLFLNNDIIYTSDVLPTALSGLLKDQSIGAVGVRLDDDPASLPQVDDPAVQHTGIQFVWNEKRGYHQPEQIRHPSLEQYLREYENSPLITSHASLLPAVTGALMLVRKADFEKLNGFSEEYEYGLEDIDFCLRLGRDLKKHCCCINDVGLPHVEGATRFKGRQKVRREVIEKNHRIFKERWGAHIRAMLTQPPPVAAKIPATLSALNQINSSLTQQAIQGAILLDGNSETIIRGWLAQPGNPEARLAILKIDDRHDFEVQCNLFRKEIRDKVNAGRHGFELVVPLHLADGNPHQVKLIDRQTQKVVAEARQTWRINRTFTEFSGFLAHSLTMPLLQAPFRDEDRLCLAHMDKLAGHLLSVTDTLDAPPKVSIVMPAYNRAGIIKASVLSALNQYYTNLELLVVDDGSTDGTGEILSVFKDPRLKVLRNDRNRGQCYSLNRAIAEAQGEYIAYLDSDNTWDARYIAAMVGAFAKLPDADALYCGQYLFRGATDTPFAVRFGSLNRSLLANRNYIDRNAFMHKKAVHDGLGGYNGSISRYVDWDFIIRTSEKYAMYSVPVLLSMYYYDLAANTMTNDDSHLPDLDVIRANQKKLAEQQQRETAEKTSPVPKNQHDPFRQYPPPPTGMHRSRSIPRTGSQSGNPGARPLWRPGDKPHPRGPGFHRQDHPGSHGRTGRFLSNPEQVRCRRSSRQ